jgi:hypothetical protein
MSVLIDYDDHYSYFDRNILVYNYLQYSDQAWMRYSAPLHCQNRLRHRDYIELFQSEGFSITEDHHKAATDKDLKTLRQISLSKRFRSYSLDDLAVHYALLVLRLPIETSSSRSHVESKHPFSAH